MWRDEIWLSGIFLGTENVIGAESEREKVKKLPSTDQSYTDDGRPVKIFHKYREDIGADKIPPVFQGGTELMFRAEIRDVISKFDLGAARFLKAEFFQSNREDRVDVDFSILENIQVRSYLNPEESNVKGRSSFFSTRYPDIPTKKWRLQFKPEDYDVAIFPPSKFQEDLWIDKKMDDVLFFSSELKNAICAAGFGKLFKFYKCKLLQIQ